MFEVGEKVIYEYFDWGTEATERETVTIVQLAADGRYHVENASGTIRRCVNFTDLSRPYVPCGPFGKVI